MPEVQDRERRWLVGLFPQEDVKFNLQLADRLNQDSAITSEVIAAGIDVRVHLNPPEGDKDWQLSASAKAFTEPLWDCCVAVARCLLATPIPTD